MNSKILLIQFKKSFKFLGLCLLGMNTHITLKAQGIYTSDSIELKKRIYKVSVITTDSKKSMGFLANLSDSGLYLVSSPLYFGSVRVTNNLHGYFYDHLEKIEIKRKGAAGRGALQGALIGLAAGAIAGFASGNDPVAPSYNNPNDPLGNALGNLFVVTSNAFAMTAGEKAVVGGLVGAATGSLVGVLIGSLVKKKFIIGRSKQKFHAMQQDILEKLRVH